MGVKMLQLELGQSIVNCGMSYIFALENKKNSVVNSYILDKAEEYYVSGYGTQEFEFPYKIGAAKQNEKLFFETTIK